jgi:hypothetical protein
MPAQVRARPIWPTGPGSQPTTRRSRVAPDPAGPLVRLQNSQSKPVPTRFDPFLGDPGLRHGYHLLLSAAWDELVQLLEADADSWILQSILTSDDAAIETVIFRRLCEARPSARAYALLGGAQVRDAELMLNTYRLDPSFPNRIVDNPPSNRTAEAEALLVQAEETLQQAIRLRPALADPWVHLLASGRLLGLDLPELRTRFENAHSRVPFRPDACRQYGLGLSARGGGSDTALFDFARWVAREAPASSAARLVVPLAHLEHGLGPAPLSLTEHLALTATVGELGPSLGAYLEATPAGAGPAELAALNAFGLAMTIVDPMTAQLVQECFRRIDNRPTSYPWCLYENEEIPSVFAEVQRTQLRSVSRFL